MQLEPRPNGHQHADKVFFVSRIPKNKSESHIQKIFERHLSGCLVSLNEAKKRSKSHFATAIVTVPAHVVESKEWLQSALKTTSGIEVSLPPLFKLFFRPDKRMLELNENENEKLQVEIQSLRKEMEAMKQKHEAEIIMMRVDHEESITQLRELINQLGNHVLSLTNNENAENPIRLFFPPRKRHPKSSLPHKR